MQLKTFWNDNGTVRVMRGGEVIKDIPVELTAKNRCWFKPNGNVKTEGMIGIISCLAGGCGRSLTGFGKCEQACFCKEDGRGGCYANHSRHAEVHRGSGYDVPFDVIYNGFKHGTENWFHIRVPNNYDLSKYSRKVWRIDCETSTSCFSLALGMTQTWAEHNPKKLFTGISSDYFFVPDDMLERTAACGNVVIGHTLSPWFAHDDNMNRIEQALRFQRMGVPTTIWVTSNPEWDEKFPEGKRLVDSAIGMFDPRQVIEVAYHDHGTHMFASMEVNPWGACCKNRYSKEGKKLVTPNLTVDGEVYNGIPYGKCKGSCKLMCGASWLKVA